MYQERGNHEEKKLEKDRGCHVERCVSCIGSCSSGRYGAGISWSGVLAGEPAHSQSVLLLKGVAAAIWNLSADRRTEELESR